MPAKALQVAIVHRHPETRNALHSVVSQLGHSIGCHAASGRELIEQARTLRPDLIVVQEHLPDMHGLDAVKQVAGEAPIPIVVVVDRHDGELLEHPQSGHVMGVLQEPVHQSDAIPVIPLALEHFARLQALRENIALLEAEVDGGPSVKSGQDDGATR